MATATRTTKALDHLAIEHKAGCPADRLESFTAERPPSKLHPAGGKVWTTRCIDCGRDAHRSLTTAPKAQGEELDD